MENLVHKKTKGHKCYLCGQRFINIHVLRKHVNVHKDREFECPTCQKAFSSRCGLRKHILSHSGDRPFKCEICKKRFVQKCTLIEHMQKMHNESVPKNFCCTCGKKIKPSEYPQCWLCNYEGRTETLVLDESLKEVKIKDKVNEDLDTNDISEGPFSDTELYHKGFPDANTSALNLTESSACVGRTPMSCIMCSELFPSIIELRQHNSQMHKPSRPFACEVCNLRFATQMSLDKHVKTHEELRPFMCLTCSKCFKNNVTLQTHLNTHREDRPFTCKTCGSTFKSLLNLKTHQITHSTMRPFECKDCGYTFKTVDRLKKHVIVHTGEKPYKCETCLKEFRHPGNLGRHYYLHTGQRLYICRICGKDFAQSVGLKQHEQVHDKTYNAQKTLTCPLCNRKYKLEMMLRRHMSKHRCEDLANLPRKIADEFILSTGS